MGKRADAGTPATLAAFENDQNVDRYPTSPYDRRFPMRSRPFLFASPACGRGRRAEGSAGEGPRLIEALVAILAVVGLCSLGGCARTAPRSPRVRRLPAPVIAAMHVENASPRDEGAAFVARALHDGGLRFGTDGSTRALWEYLRLAHRTVAASEARPGDVLFFDTRAGDADPDCDDVTDHAGIVEGVE